MQRKELIELAQRVNATWPQAAANLGDATLAVWWDTLKDVDLPLALAGVESLHREGKEFAPTAGMILKRTVELQLDPPDWADAARELGKCLAYGERVYRQGGVPRRPRLAVGAGPVVGQGVRPVGGVAADRGVGVRHRRGGAAPQQVVRLRGQDRRGPHAVGVGGPWGAEVGAGQRPEAPGRGAEGAWSRARGQREQRRPARGVAHRGRAPSPLQGAFKERWLRQRRAEGMPYSRIAGKPRYKLSLVEPWLEVHGYIEPRGAG
jgi:hypothetical protein